MLVYRGLGFTGFVGFMGLKGLKGLTGLRLIGVAVDNLVLTS